MSSTRTRTARTSAARTDAVLSEGDAAPDFTLPDQHGEEVTLSELRGETVVVCFDPRADTVRDGDTVMIEVTKP